MSVRSILRPALLTLNGSFGLLGTSNLLSPEPKTVAVSTGQTPDANFLVQTNTSIVVDTFILGFVDGAGLDTLTVNFGGRAGVENIVVAQAALLPTKVLGGRRHAVVQLAEPFESNLFGFNVVGASGSPPAGISFGLFAVGRAFRPTWGGEWGGGVGLVDTATVTRRRDGGFGIDPGVRAMLPQWTFGDLSDTERADLFGLLHNAGESEPMLVIEGADTGPTLSEQVHWGLFTRIEAYERTAPGSTRWSLRFQDWV